MKNFLNYPGIEILEKHQITNPVTSWIYLIFSTLFAIVFIVGLVFLIRNIIRHKASVILNICLILCLLIPLIICISSIGTSIDSLIHPIYEYSIKVSPNISIEWLEKECESVSIITGSDSGNIFDVRIKGN